MACYGDKGVEHLLKLLQVNNKNRIVNNLYHKVYTNTQ